ncbi:MAG: hypothetical protein KKC20_13205 [Proteobacteria bacterium]|nr:hypothetical protein [Pseudomonadota bacterium]
MSAVTLFKSLKETYIQDADDGELEWKRLYSGLLEIPDAHYTTFIRLSYFRQCKGAVQRFQEIPDLYKIYKSPTKLFVSHKWEERNHPDRSRRTLKKLLSLTQTSRDDTAVWWDFCSLPQKNSQTGLDDRSAELKEFFKYQLTLIPLIILDSQSMFLWAEAGTHSGWCCVELLITHALLNHLNQMIYKRKNDFCKPPLFITQLESGPLIESDLYRFEHQIFYKLYSSDVANDWHKKLITWMNIQLNQGKPTPYSHVIRKVTPELISKMILEFNLTFTNGSDSKTVSDMLFKLYNKLSFEPFDSFKWEGQADLLSMWHYVKGCLGSCVVPKTYYWF